jgi:hypothetical protein
MDVSGWDDPGEYRMDILEAKSTAASLDDVRAFLAAIGRGKAEACIVSVLRAGPISERIDEYADVYRRGLSEVEAFLAKRATRRL